MRHTRLSLVLIALALVVAACNQDSDDTTTTAESTTTETTTTVTTTNVEVESARPDLNPASVAISYLPIDLGPYTGFDRCAWTSQGNPNLQARCEQIAADGYEPEEFVADFTDGATPTEVRTYADPAHRCFFRRNEIVTPAIHDGETAADRSFARIAPRAELMSDLGDLPGGLLIYEVADPVEVTSALVEAGIPASPRYVLMPSPIWRFGPAGPALPADPGIAEGQGSLAGPGRLLPIKGTTITIIDTRSGTASPPEPAELSSALQGHGQFIAGIVERLLPDAMIVERSALKTNGEASPVPTEQSIGKAIEDAIAGELKGGGVINLSLGTYTCWPDHVPLELAARLGEMAAEGPDVAVVAAAGNDSHVLGEPVFWPAGFSDPALVGTAVASWKFLSTYESLNTAIAALLDRPNVIGVGALVHDADHGDWRPAGFSNQVAATVWAPGANIVSEHPRWDRFAQWDGTSFATPHVAAVIAKCAVTSANGYRDALAEVRNDGNC